MMHHQTAYVQQYQQSLIQQSHPQPQQFNQMHSNHSHQPQMPTMQQLTKLGKRPIAPAPAPSQQQPQTSTASLELNHQLNRVSSTITSTSKKTKMTYAHMAYAATQPASVQRRNARERNRVKQVNMGFNNLRQHIPSDVVTALGNAGRGASKKLSKVDTLRIAVEYIRRLQGMIDESDVESLSSGSGSSNSSASNNSYYSPSPVQCSSMQLPPPCSESSASPTPSYISDNSSIGQTNYVPPATFKYETYDAFNPDEEELLDAITWWQQQWEIERWFAHARHRITATRHVIKCAQGKYPLEFSFFLPFLFLLLLLLPRAATSIVVRFCINLHAHISIAKWFIVHSQVINSNENAANEIKIEKQSHAPDKFPSPKRWHTECDTNVVVFLFEKWTWYSIFFSRKHRRRKSHLQKKINSVCARERKSEIRAWHRPHFCFLDHNVQGGYDFFCVRMKSLLYLSLSLSLVLFKFIVFEY